MNYIDFHCDTLMKAWMGRKKTLSAPGGMVSLAGLKEGGCKAQFFAIFMPPVNLKKIAGLFLPKDEAYIEKNLQIFRNTVMRYPDAFAEASSMKDIESNRAAGKISGILTLEDGRAVDGKIENLERFYGMGIRLISLTWNHANCFGFPNSSDSSVMEKGLTDFGREAVARMNELGMIVDVSHLSDGGFRDVAALCKKPFVASHSNCRSINPHPRSMTDEMIRTLADKGGVMGVNFGPEFLTGDVKAKESRTEALVAQLRHMMNVGGEDCPAIGTDFDGVGGRLEIGSPGQMPRLFEALAESGFTAGQIEKIACRNAERVIAEVL